MLLPKEEEEESNGLFCLDRTGGERMDGWLGYRVSREKAEVKGLAEVLDVFAVTTGVLL